MYQLTLAPIWFPHWPAWRWTISLIFIFKGWRCSRVDCSTLLCMVLQNGASAGFIPNKAPPFPPDLNTSLAKYVNVVYRQNFTPIESLQSSLALDIFACQSVFSQTCDALVWPTSVMIMAAQITVNRVHISMDTFKWSFRHERLLGSKMSSLRTDLSLLYVGIEKDDRVTVQFPTFHVAYFQNTGYPLWKLLCAGGIIHDWLGTLGLICAKVQHP